MMEVNLNKMCRICLKEEDNLKSIFQSDENSTNYISIPNKIMACSPVQVFVGDGLPEHICHECLAQVDLAYDFREKCQSADATLRKYLSLVEPVYSTTGKNNDPSIKAQEESQKTIEPESQPVDYNSTQFVFQKEEASSSTKENNLTGGVFKNDGDYSLLTDKKKKKLENGIDNEKKKRTKDEKYVKCPICKKTFAYLCILKDHMVQHTGAKPYLCSACGKLFGHTASLKNHMKTHYSDKPHKCDRCELSFHRRAHLVLHMRTHTGEKPFVCDVCGRDFAQGSYLKEHMRVHSGEKPFVCDYCGHLFARKSCLVMHRRVHTGELPYTCPECGKGFSQRSQRKRHIKRNHKGSPCLKANGELILKDLNFKNQNTNQEGVLSENSLTENMLHVNSLDLLQSNITLQKEVGMPVQQCESTPTNSTNLINYLPNPPSWLYSP